jgi:hypothetical protein
LLENVEETTRAGAAEIAVDRAHFAPVDARLLDHHSLALAQRDFALELRVQIGHNFGRPAVERVRVDRAGRREAFQGLKKGRSREEGKWVDVQAVGR